MSDRSQYGDYSARMNRVLDKPIKMLVVVLMMTVAWVVIQASVEHYLPSVEKIELSYSYGVRAEVFYNPYVGIPHIDSSMSYSDIEFAEHVDSVNWFVLPDAQAYYIVSIVQADSASIERYLNQIAEPY